VMLWRGRTVLELAAFSALPGLPPRLRAGRLTG
jgi:hypothetical protein